MKEVLKYKLIFQKEMKDLEDIFIFFLHREIFNSFIYVNWYCSDKWNAKEFLNQDQKIKDYVYKFNETNDQVYLKYQKEKNILFDIYSYIFESDDFNNEIFWFFNYYDCSFHTLRLHINLYTLFDSIIQKLYSTKISKNQYNILIWENFWFQKINQEKMYLFDQSWKKSSITTISNIISDILNVLNEKWIHSHFWIIYVLLKEILYFLKLKTLPLIKNHTKSIIFKKEDLEILKKELLKYINWEIQYSKLINLKEYQEIIKNTHLWYILNLFEEINLIFQKHEKNIDQKYKIYLDQYFNFNVIKHHKMLFN